MTCGSFGTSGRFADVPRAPNEPGLITSFQGYAVVMFSCRTRGFCPSCHAKRLDEWGEWMREALLLDVPHLMLRGAVERHLEIIGEAARICR